MNSLFYSNNNTICRTCLTVKEDLKPLFESDAATMLNECQFVQVSKDDGLPHQVCSNCHDVLVQSYNFKKQCVESEKTLKHLISKDLDILKCKPTESMNKNESVKELDQSHYKRTINKHACVQCNKKLSTLQALKRHLQMHERKKKYKCKECNEEYQDLNELENHLCVTNRSTAKNSRGKDLKHDIPEDFTSFLDADPPPPLPFGCSQCSQSFNAQCDLDLHLSTHAMNGEFVCSRCNKQFATRQMLKRHIKTHMLHKPHICRECGKGFAESHALTKHLRKHTGQPREKKHLCTVCGQGFSEPFYLNVHMRKHTGERPLMCSACGKSFADPRSLKAHNMTHTGERPYKCNICDKAFSQSVNLTKHIRVHTGEKPYVCSECGKCFTQSSSLDKHSRTHTGERPYACEHCPKRAYNNPDGSKQISEQQNCTELKLEQSFALQNLDTFHNVIERTVDIGLSERLYFNLA
ncbi:hypothetical protein ILUMI_07295 [Ignelater luminosus]|uniref:Uncharacterized protein n=1 Tax=Ignelater luminosus TaxID=2038154 RepID=A0A8K0D8L1_IGNLU|nr:hypothetical protein ILUMI_07295 [Ignelater luminosus]